MPPKGAFQQIKLGAQDVHFRADVLVQNLARDHRFMGQGIACLHVFNDKRLNGFSSSST